MPIVLAPGSALAGIKVEDEVTYNIGGVIYAGKIRAIAPDDLRPTYLGLDIDCQDFTTVLEDEICTSARSVVETDAQRISWLLQSFDRRGVTAYHVQTLYASMPPQNFAGKTLREAIKAVLAYSNGSFYVDFAKDLHTFVSESSVAPFALSDSPDGVTSFGYAAFEYPQDSMDLRNAVYVIPGRTVPTVADSGTDTITTGGAVAGASITVASIKAAADQSFKLVAIGSPAVGTNTQVAPQFDKPTRAGNTVVAWVDSSSSDSPATTAPGWIEVGHPASPDQASFKLAAWVKVACGDAEVAPIFTTVFGLVPMTAMLAEFSGGPQDSAADKTNTAWWNGPPAPSTVSVTNPSADASTGDLILMLARWGLSAPAAATSSPSFNNAAAVPVAMFTDSSGSRWHSFSYGIVPSAVPTWYTHEASIALYGRREATFTDTNVTTQAALDALGAAKLLELAIPLRHASCKVDQVGLAAGQIVSVTNALHGLSAQPFRIQGVETKYSENVPRFSIEFADPQPTLATQFQDVRDEIPSSSVASSATSASQVGTLVFSPVSATQGPFTALTDMTGMSATITPATGRRIKISAVVPLSSTVATDIVAIQILDGATQLGGGQDICPSIGGFIDLYAEGYFVGDGAAHAIKVQAERASGTGNITMQAGQTQVGVKHLANFLIEDIGT